MKLEPVVASDLEAEESPYRVVRWVAWGESYSARRRRADLVLHLRHTIDTAFGGWLREPHYTAALAALDAAVAEAKRRGGVQPRPADLPQTTYADAIGAVPKPPKRAPVPSAPPPPPPTPLVLTAEERQALAALPVLERLLKRAG